MSTIRSKARKIINRWFILLHRFSPKLSPYQYWEQRAHKFGVRSVLNIGHKENEIEDVTKMQKETLFPFLREQLKLEDQHLLDFGCGPGRFTRDLAGLIGGSAVGVDPIQHFLDLAQTAEHVEYRRITNGIIPAADHSFDIVWVCLVLGGIIDEQELTDAVREIDRVLKPEGLLFMAENTSEKPDSEYWKFRSVEEYGNLFSFITLSHISDYSDLGERISIFAGRKYE